MTPLNLLPFFVIGLFGAVHCVGMCGGIVGALSAAGAPRRPFPVAVTTLPPPAGGTARRALAYNAGRIGSYMTAGAIAGGLAGGAQALSGVAALQTGVYWIANLMLVALGLYLTGAWRGLALLELAGAGLWRRIQPLARPLLPMDTLPRALVTGALWGWLPCGMVYSVLLSAMLSGSAWSGAAVMLAFGLGTLPALLAMGLAGARLSLWSRARGVRIAGGLVVLAFGMAGLLRAAGGMTPAWLDALCLAARAHS